MKTTIEGRTKLLVPAQSLTSKVPATFPVFFNPAAKLNRDVSVAIASVTAPQTYLDALAGTGARGVRIANEAGHDIAVTLVDFNRASLSVAAKNIRKNGLSDRCSQLHSETNRYLHSRFEREEKFDAVDVDPFGTPAPYLQGAIIASKDGATLSFTATDAAVLCGVYQPVALRRYWAATPRSEFVHETAIRVLTGFVARLAGMLDIGITPIAAHSTLHYLRVYVRLTRGATAADETQGFMGYVMQCNSCYERFSGERPYDKCPACQRRVHSAGPLWLGELCDESIVNEAAQFCTNRGWDAASEVLSSQVGMDEYPPYSYSLERAASRLGMSSVQIEKVIERMTSTGHSCMRQPFEELSLKTDSGRTALETAVKEASRKLL